MNRRETLAGCATESINTAHRKLLQANNLIDVRADEDALRVLRQARDEIESAGRRLRGEWPGDDVNGGPTAIRPRSAGLDEEQ